MKGQTILVISGKNSLKIKKNTLIPASEGRVSKVDTALRYFPGHSAETASRYLRRAIHDDPLIREELAAIGVRKRVHYYTPAQIVVLDTFFA